MPVSKAKQPNKQDIMVDHLRTDDLPEIARLYEEAFAEHFLGHMGQKFLELFCSQFIDSATNFGYVAKCDGKAVGFLLGSIDNAPFDKFYRQNFMAVALMVMKRYAVDPFVRKEMTKKLGNVVDALKSLLPFSNKDSNGNQLNTSPSARVMGIAVDANYRGMGVANSLSAHYCADLKSKGIKEVGLSVNIWNERAIKFYIKDGWIEEERCETSLSFTRTI